MQAGESRADEHSNLRHDGDIKGKKGDCYLVDCVATGSDQGTCGNLKFSLKSLLEEEIFPLVESLVKDKYKGFVPVFQSDSADLHIDAEYIKYVKGYCKEKGWVWAPQAPQMPHANNLDLAVFPLMSSQRSVLARESSNSEAPVEEIWTAVQSVWNDLQNSTIDK
ncbi:hypothetical protein IV203_009029 [Nitzschia inconspicua]|uniref:Uncharacterized protein n=1 Tax=Nitzschia inconspicua TaxID=303405 RepID=A0A9K3L1D5_9STRA|nr:hypothetical protein IV203_009029 [Nitzschia inconspicua]